MSRNQWHILREGDTVTVTRRRPVRWDVYAETRLGLGRPLRVAQQIRQDLWRAVQRQRGMLPAVAVTLAADGLLIRAGGRVESAFNPVTLERMIVTVLEKPENRARWLRFGCSRAQLRKPPEGAKRFLQAEEGDQ